MSKSVERRLTRLEQAMTTTAEARTGKGHWLISEKGEDREAKEAALRASEEWEEGDWITHWIVVDPPQRNA